MSPYRSKDSKAYGSSHPGARDVRWAEALSESRKGQPDAKWRALRPRWVFLSVFPALAVIGGIVGYALVRGVSQFETPVISAETEPIKSQPESPGGLDIPYQGVAVLSNGAPDHANLPVERLLPSPETPLPVQTESAEAEATTELEALALAGSPLEYAPGPVENMLPEAVGPLASAPEPPPASAAQVAAPRDPQRRRDHQAKPAPNCLGKFIAGRRACEIF